MATKAILLAEDDLAIARMYQTKFEASGYKVTAVADGQAAYEALKADSPALALLDINMPELTGFEVLAKLKGKLGGVKLIMLTNSSTDADRQSAASYGADYIVKAEYTPGSLLAHINELLGVTK